jgi:hypothetical protein
MFDDLSDLRPTEPDDEGEASDDELLADLASEDELLSDLVADEEPVSPPFAFEDPTVPRFGDDLTFDDPLTTQAATPVRRARRERERLFLGMTAQQRAVLAVFLFLDTAVLGLLILLAAGAISLPFV